MRFGIPLEEIKNDGWTQSTFWKTLEMVEAPRTRTEHFSTYGLRMCCKGMSMLLGLFWLVKCMKYRDVMEGIKVCDESNDTLTFCFDKNMQQFAQCVDKLFRFNANSILFYETIMVPKRVIGRLFRWHCCVFYHMGHASNDIFWVYITWNKLSETEDWASILKDWIGLTLLVWKLQVRVDMAKIYTRIRRRVKYDESMREREMVRSSRIW